MRLSKRLNTTKSFILNRQQEENYSLTHATSFFEAIIVSYLLFLKISTSQYFTNQVFLLYDFYRVTVMAENISYS